MSDAEILAEMHPILLDWAHEAGADILWFKAWHSIDDGHWHHLTAFGRERKTKKFVHNTISKRA